MREYKAEPTENDSSWTLQYWQVKLYEPPNEPVVITTDARSICERYAEHLNAVYWAGIDDIKSGRVIV